MQQATWDERPGEWEDPSRTVHGEEQATPTTPQAKRHTKHGQEWAREGPVLTRVIHRNVEHDEDEEEEDAMSL